MEDIQQRVNQPMDVELDPRISRWQPYIQDLLSKNITDVRQLVIIEKQLEMIVQLSPLINLQKLDLSVNNITKMENLDTVKNIRSLYLPNNKIQILQNIQKLHRLEKLVVNDNKISDMNFNPPQTAQPNNQLNQQISKNILSIKKMISFQLPSLELINLDSNQLKSVESLCKISLPNLTEICLYNNKITNLNPLRKINSQKVISLWINSNKISQYNSLYSMNLLNLLSFLYDTNFSTQKLLFKLQSQQKLFNQKRNLFINKSLDRIKKNQQKK